MGQINPDKTFAIIIGTSVYQCEELHNLESVYDNMYGVNDVLIRVLGIPTTNRIWLTDAKRSEILSTLKDPGGRAAEFETLIIYFSGHGIIDEDRSNYYLGLKETDLDDLGDTSISISKLSERLGNRNWNIILVIDACFSEKSFETFNQRNFFIMASSSRSATSKYPLNEENSAFTSKFIETIKNGIENGPEDLTCENIFECVQQKLTDDGFPEPRKSSRNDVGDLVLIKNKAMGQHIETNEVLADSLFKELRSYNDKMAQEVQALNLSISNNPEGEKKKFILKKFPVFISKFLCALLSNKSTDLHDVTTFYEHLVRFIGIILLSELNRIKNRPMSDNQVPTWYSSDIDFHINLIRNFPIDQIDDLFVHEIISQKGVIANTIGEIEAEKKQQDSDVMATLLIKLIGHLKFLANYKFISVRFIDVKRRYLDPTVFRHQVSDLSGEIFNKYEYSLILNSGCLNSNSILLFRTDQITNIHEADQYLNLWPLIIDINAYRLTNETPELFMFDKKDDLGRFIFKSVFDESQQAREYQDIDNDLEPSLKNKYFEEFESRIHAPI